MALQWIIDKSESLSINRKPVVARTTARDGSIRIVSRGSQPARIEVKVADGIPWTSLKADIYDLDSMSYSTPQTVTIPFSKYPWYYNNANPGAGAESFSVYLLQVPEWTLFARNQVSWSGPFILVQAI